MTVIPFPGGSHSVPGEVNRELVDKANCHDIAAKIMVPLTEVQTALTLLMGMMEALHSGAPMTELELGNAELIRSLCRALACTCPRSARYEDREFYWAVIRHIRQMDAAPPP